MFTLTRRGFRSSTQYRRGSLCARWLNADPAGLAGGLNLYSYVGNNPIAGIDPLGLWVISLRVNGGGTAFLGVTFSIALAFDNHGDVALQVGGKPDAQGLNRANVISIGPPLGAASIGATGGFTITNAATIADQYGNTKEIGIYAAAGVAVDTGFVWGTGRNDSGGNTYIGWDFGIGAGSPGVALQASVLKTQPIWQNDNLKRKEECP